MVGNSVAWLLFFWSSKTLNNAFKIKSTTIVIIDALAKCSSTLRTAWSKIVRKLPLICCKSTVSWNLPVVGTNIVAAFGASVTSLVLVVIRHHVGELGLVVILFTFIINVLQRPPLVVNIGLGGQEWVHWEIWKNERSRRVVVDEKDVMEILEVKLLYLLIRCLLRDRWYTIDMD